MKGIKPLQGWLQYPSSGFQCLNWFQEVEKLISRTMIDYNAKLIPDGTYHVYNRANGNEQLFVNEGNYKYFLKRYKQYVSPVADTFCYCLMANHFHFLIRIRPYIDIENHFLKNAHPKNRDGYKDLNPEAKQSSLSKHLSKQFSHFFNSYTQSFNKQQSRKGNLFRHTFSRKRIKDEVYLKKLVHYIHHNPLEAKLCKKLEQWKFSSYNAIVSEKHTNVKRELVLDIFENLENFIIVHKESPHLTGLEF